jgi:hypothetical protein
MESLNRTRAIEIEGTVEVWSEDGMEMRVDERLREDRWSALLSSPVICRPSNGNILTRLRRSRVGTSTANM